MKISDLRKTISSRLARLDPALLGLVITLLALMAIFTLKSPYFLTVRNWLNIGRAVSIRGVVALGMTVIMVAGGLDLSLAAVMSATTMAVYALLKAGAPEPLTVVLGLLFGATMGSLNGLVVTKGRITPIIATLAMSNLIGGTGVALTGGGQSLGISMSQFAFLARGRVGTIPVPLILWSLGCVAIYVLLRYTRFGHYSYSIGANPLACRVSGVRVDYWRFLMFVLEGALAGFGGLLIISQTGSAATTQWGSAGLGSQFDVIAAVILGGAGLAGGRGSIVGTVLGMILLGVLANGMTLTGIPPFWHTVLRGLILLVAILVDTWRTGGFR